MLGMLKKLIWGFLDEELKALSAPRSPQWKKLRDEHLRAHPACEVCGNLKKVVPHHIVPVHQDPSRELDPGNLISLCEGDTFNCHLFFGHLRNWCKDNSNVAEDARAWREKTMGNHLGH